MKLFIANTSSSIQKGTITCISNRLLDAKNSALSLLTLIQDTGINVGKLVESMKECVINLNSTSNAADKMSSATCLSSVRLSCINSVLL